MHGAISLQSFNGINKLDAAPEELLQGFHAGIAAQEVTMRTGLVLLLIAISGFPARGLDPRTKTILVDEPLGSDPVRIVKVMEGATELQSDGHPYPNKYVWEAAFYAGDNWLNDLSFVVKNVSGKKIVYAAVLCNLYETAEWQDEHANRRSNPLPGQISNRAGRRPEQALYSALLGRKHQPDTDRPSLELAPGQEFTIAAENPDESNIDKETPISSITACSGGISQIFFDDGTRWQPHSYSRADPDRPGHWITMSFEEWSGAKKTAE